MILIVGCGFLGSYLAKYATSQTSEPIIATVRNMDSAAPMQGVEYVRCDITDSSSLTELAQKCSLRSCFTGLKNCRCCVLCNNGSDFFAFTVIHSTKGGEVVSSAMSWIYFLIVLGIIGAVAALLSAYVFYQKRD